MFCVNCGNQMADGERFCTKCGAPLDQAAAAKPAPPAQMGFAGQVPPPPPPKKSGKGSIVVIVVAIIVIVAAVAIIAMTLLPTVVSGGGASSGSSSAAAVSSSASKASNDASSTSSASNSNTAEGVGSASSASAGSASSGAAAERQQSEPVDEAGLLSDAEAYQNMNVFLSNFSETGMQSIDVGTASASDLARFALSHDVINSNSFIETAPAADATTNNAGNRMGSRESADRVSELVERYMGTGVNFSSLSGNPYAYRGGYVYFSASDVERSPQGVANVIGSKVLSNGQIEVQFRVYKGSGYDATDEGLYALSANELMQRLGTQSAAYEGTAVVQTGGSNETTNGLTLVSYDVEM